MNTCCNEDNSKTEEHRECVSFMNINLVVNQERAVCLDCGTHFNLNKYIEDNAVKVRREYNNLMGIPNFQVYV